MGDSGHEEEFHDAEEVDMMTVRVRVQVRRKLNTERNWKNEGESMETLRDSKRHGLAVTRRRERVCAYAFACSFVRSVGRVGWLVAWQHATRRYNAKTLNGEFDIMVKSDGSDTVLQVKEKIAVRYN